MKCEDLTLISTSQEIVNILKMIKTIAVIGLSPNESRPSFKVSKYMQTHGYKIIPVHPKANMILGQKVYSSLDQITQNIDCINVFRKSDTLPSIVNEILKRNDIKVLWTQQGIINNEACQKAKDAGLHVIQNRCLMIEHRAMKG